MANWHQRAVEVLRRDWGLAAEPTVPETGWTNLTWQAGHFWLTCRPAGQADRLRREIELFARINRESPHSGVCAPVTVPTSDGRCYAEAYDHVWRLTETLAGVEPPSSRLAHYPVIGAAVARLHAVLAGFDGRPAVLDEGVLSRVLGLITEEPPAAITALQFADQACLDHGLKAVEAGYDRLASADRQLLHGDPGPSNIRTDPRTMALVGALDLDGAGVGPVAFDLAAVGIGAFSWWHAPGFDPVAALAGALDEYRRRGGRPVDPAAVYLCMLAKEIRLLRSMLVGAIPRKPDGPWVDWHLARYRRILRAWSEQPWRSA
ncbi:Ser/Thr protein kinase RdoA (MazF antagonist) [Kitasatospora sp. GP30]|uniref:phosphotransferase enzyme family protein n=1 Tax=Kitasatospora sp. GP30 TaxID=3035084 RepID=UPI000C70EF68|nr:phosphotransferase [Kitasatospora sp. GP30]MDH6139952.1 Ser/Thr protein kinase RdoA (MazF antagonist) [Kitasatospora sp. GP30]